MATVTCQPPWCIPQTESRRGNHLSFLVAIESKWPQWFGARAQNVDSHDACLIFQELPLISETSSTQPFSCSTVICYSAVVLIPSILKMKVKPLTALIIIWRFRLCPQSCTIVAASCCQCQHLRVKYKARLINHWACARPGRRLWPQPVPGRLPAPSLFCNFEHCIEMKKQKTINDIHVGSWVLEVNLKHRPTALQRTAHVAMWARRHVSKIITV